MTPNHLTQVDLSDGPELSDAAHYVLHSLVRHMNRKCIDLRSVSDIAMGMNQPSDLIQDGLAELVDLDIIRRVPQGHRVSAELEILNCCKHLPIWGSGGKKSLGQESTSEQEFLSLKDSLDCRCDLTNAPCGAVRCARTPTDRSLLGVVIDESSLGECRSLSGPRVGGQATPSRKLKPGTPYALAYEFDSEIRIALGELGPGTTRSASPTNLGALAGSFSRWMREDSITAEDIRWMIQRFMLASAWWVGKTPWQVFLAKRNALLGFRASNDAGEADRYDAEAWLKPAYEDPAVRTAEYWA